MKTTTYYIINYDFGGYTKHKRYKNYTIAVNFFNIIKDIDQFYAAELVKLKITIDDIEHKITREKTIIDEWSKYHENNS